MKWRSEAVKEFWKAVDDLCRELGATLNTHILVTTRRDVDASIAQRIYVVPLTRFVGDPPIFDRKDVPYVQLRVDGTKVKIETIHIETDDDRTN